MHPHRLLSIVVTLAALLLPGCLKRTETITVAPDGRVRINFVAEGDKDDIDSGDAMPSSQAGWTVQRSFHLDKQHKRVDKLTASIELPPGQPLPARFATTEQLARICLAFPTRLTIEHRPDGVYYNFQRIYRRREMADAQYHRDRILTDKIKKLAEQGLEKLDPAQRRRVLQAWLEVQYHDVVRFAEQALTAIAARLPVDARLTLHRTIRQALYKQDWRQLDKILTLPQPQRNEALSRYADRALARTQRAIRQCLSSLRISPDKIERFEAAFTQARKRFEITQDLDDESFQVRLSLPGELIGHNAQRVEDAYIVWTFDGKALHDRDHVLLASSRLRPAAPTTRPARP